jgi:dihydroceramidase
MTAETRKNWSIESGRAVLASAGVRFEVPGFWGQPTATVDWCERNYVHSFYVCELLNTLSSFSMVAAGLIGIALHQRLLEKRFLLAFAAVCLVGVGSITFHASLRFELQLLDELPMLYSALIMVYILLENRAERRFGAWFPALLVVHALLVTTLTAFTRGKLQFYLFHASFGSLEFFGLYRVYRISRRSSDVVVHRLFRVGMGAYAVALFCWITDLKACETLDGTLPRLGLVNPQLHAWWHILVSVGLYLLVVLVAYDRLQVLGRKPRIDRWLGFVPRVIAPQA